MINSPNTSIFDTRTLNDIYDEIREVYLSNDFPWVIGYSGGKDSTATLQLVWSALSELPSGDLYKPLYIIASDTLVEAPSIVDKIDATLNRIQSVAQRKKLPITAQKVIPQVSDTFWVNLIGRGYPAPSNRFRWCTERMKIKPANAFILDRAAEFGEVVMVLGARKDESATRAQVMSNKHRQVPGTRLTRHSELARAYVYTPIEDFSADDVWTYLLQVPSPWGDNNRDLVALYRTAQAGECPLVIDTTTPSCGNSRFGCWVCTVVERDRTMEALVDSGEDWMEPLLEFRNQLAETQVPEKKDQVRSFKRRNGQTIYKDGRLIPGPYEPWYRKKLLRQLLTMQREIRQSREPNMTLIHPAELFEIRRIWREDFSDWEDSVVEIYREVMGNDLDWPYDDIGTFGLDDFELLKDICKNYDIPPQMISRLIDTERRMQGMSRRAGIFSEIRRIVNEEWRNRDEILDAYQDEIEHRNQIGLE